MSQVRKNCLDTKLELLERGKIPKSRIEKKIGCVTTLFVREFPDMTTYEAVKYQKRINKIMDKYGYNIRNE